MANIDYYLTQISSAIYGEEVRGSIVDAIRTCYTDRSGLSDVLEEIRRMQSAIPEKDIMSGSYHPTFDYAEQDVYTTISTTNLPIDEVFTLINKTEKVNNEWVHFRIEVFDRDMETLYDETIWGVVLVTRKITGAKWLKITVTIGSGSTISANTVNDICNGCTLYNHLLVYSNDEEHFIEDAFVSGSRATNSSDILPVVDTQRYSSIFLYHVSQIDYIMNLLRSRYNFYFAFYTADLEYMTEGNWHANDATIESEAPANSVYFRIICKVADGQTISKETALTELNDKTFIINPTMDYGSITQNSDGEIVPVGLHRMVTKNFIPVNNGRVLLYNENYDYAISVYDADHAWMYNTAFYGFNTAYEMLKDVKYRDKYIRIVIAKAGDHNAEISKSDIVSFGKLFEVVEVSDEINASIDTYKYPVYYDEEVSQTLNSVGNATFPDSVIFAMITDLHNNADDIAETLSSQIDVLRKISDSCRLDFVILGGDLSDGIFKDRAAALERFTQIVNCFASIGVPVLALRGNHDDNSYQGNKGVNYIVNKHDYYARVIAPLAENIVAPELSYYYHDFDYADTRVICLDYLDYPEIITNGAYENVGSGAAWRGYSNAQVAWLCNTLSSNSKSKVIVTSHYSTHPNLMPETSLGVLNRNADSISAAMRAFNSRGTFSFGGTVYNFSNATGKILVQVTGHSHALGAFADGGIIWSTTGSPSPEVTKRSHDSTAYETMSERPYFDKDEAHFNIFAVTENSVKIFSFGAMGDYSFNIGD